MSTHVRFSMTLRFFNSFLPCGDNSHLLITFANSLDPDQARQNVGPDLMVFPTEFFENKSADDKTIMQSLSACRVCKYVPPGLVFFFYTSLFVI